MKCLVFLMCATAVTAHICMISPPQRGSMMGINKAGAVDCMLTKAQCGGRMMGSNAITLLSGQNFTVTFQKNLDHWLQATPGHFTISFGIEASPQMLMMIPDMGEPSLTLYSMNVTIPSDTPLGKYIIQTQYVTKNPAAPPMFYQCGDVIVLPNL